MLFEILKDRRFHRLALVCALAGVGLALLVWKLGYGLEEARDGWKWLEEFMSERPWVLFLAIVILPGFPVPISPVMLLVGALLHEHPLLACLGSLAALMANQSWTYWVAACPGRSMVEWMLRRYNIQVPEVAPVNHMKWLLIVRLTPAFPLFIQNYLLGFVRIPFLRYLWVSIACSGSIASGMVLTGAGVGGGKIGPMLGGLSIIVVAAVILRSVGKRRLRGS